MKRAIELLAPAGDLDSLKAAILAGADAVYFGLDKFNARNRAENIRIDDLPGIVRLAHEYNCQVFITLNVLIVDSEFPALISLLNKLINIHIDGVIVQDLGLFYLLSTYFKGFKIHASTQLTTHNEGQIQFLSRLNATRVNLSRELNLHEIKALTLVAHQSKLAVEVFVHGSNCISFSGICYMSSVQGGNSGNRGRCSQPCRDQYETTPEGNDFPLNLKDNSAYSDLLAIADAGVDSIKIEGRIKKFHYVFTVVEAWRKQLQRLYNQTEQSADKSELYSVFNRDFSNSYLSGGIHKEMFIDNPRDHSAIHLAGQNGCLTDAKIEKAKGDIYDDRTVMINSVRSRIEQMSIAKTPLNICISGECGTPLKVRITTPEVSFEVLSASNLAATGKLPITHDVLIKRLKAINDTEYFVEELDTKQLPENLYLPFKTLTTLKRDLLFILNGKRELFDPVDVPDLKPRNRIQVKPALSVLISSVTDLHLCRETTASIYFQLPNCLKNNWPEYVTLFTENAAITPWFPAVLIGDDYLAAVNLLEEIKPAQIVTDNTGIAYKAFQMGIQWIAGLSLNIVNSFSLKCLKENFDCSGAFISNEISQTQIRNIQCPEDFKLYYSIYHPIVLMTSRQCLFHQVIGCCKDEIDADCIQNCEQSASITNLKEVSFHIQKQKGNYHQVYNAANFLNAGIVSDLPDRFSGFVIDLRDVTTDTKVESDKTSIIQLFENLLEGKPDSKEILLKSIQHTTNVQYTKGI